MTTKSKPQTIELGSARKVTRTEFQGDILELDNPVLARRL